jgi:cell division protein FtsQ
MMTSPAWVVRHPNQIEIQGNELLSDEAIQTLLPIRYPQSILTIRPQAIAQALRAKAPITAVTVTRQLYPAGLTVHVQERYPVAIAYPAAITPGAAQTSAVAGSTQVGVLDEEGVWIPLDRYNSLNGSMHLPTLKVFGMREAHRPYWVDLYTAIRQSPVAISEVDWREPTNLILRTELGQVHFGSYGTQFPQQLQALDQMRHLANEIDLQTVAYIDLRNPEVPLVQLLTQNQADETLSVPPATQEEMVDEAVQ